jgi:probable F420-dependent oxidoreductase
VKFIFQYPELAGVDGDLLDAGSVTDVAGALEHAGWYGIAFTEHPAPGNRWLNNGGHQTLDPFVALGNAAGVTRHLRLITYLTVAAYRNPLLLAKSAATVDKLSGGRFILGIGAGYQKSEFYALGAPFAERGALLDEALRVLKLHWSGEPFDFAGKHFDARDVIARPRPAQNPIPIWVGGNADAVLRRVAEHADGWMPLTGSDALFRTTKTPGLRTAEQIGARIAEVRTQAGERAGALSFVVAYNQLDPNDATSDAARHERAFEELGTHGITHVVIDAATGGARSTSQFIADFGTTYFASS